MSDNEGMKNVATYYFKPTITNNKTTSATELDDQHHLLANAGFV